MKIAVIGAGAAGLFVASNIKGALIDLYEKNHTPGVKINITGKGRCNLTNDCTKEEFMENLTTNPRFMNSAFSAFSPQDCMAFFEKAGLKLCVERGRRVFPESSKASDVTKVLVGECKKNGVNFIFEKVVDVAKHGDFYRVKSEIREKEYDAVVVCCGGVSYPETGSTGDGYEFAVKLGHSVTPIRPALVPIETVQSVSSIAGLNLRNVKITAVCGKKEFSDFGEVEFYKKGLCGPTVLSLSSRINKLDLTGAHLVVDLKPALSEEKLDARLQRDISSGKNKTLRDVILGLLPSKMVEYFAFMAKISLDKRTDRITREDRKSIVSTLKGMKFEIKKLGDVQRGIVTCGGVEVKELDPKTMMSKISKNLYFAGEIVDVDALTGGYNLQIAFSTAFLVSKDINSKIV